MCQFLHPSPVDQSLFHRPVTSPQKSEKVGDHKDSRSSTVCSWLLIENTPGGDRAPHFSEGRDKTANGPGELSSPASSSSCNSSDTTSARSFLQLVLYVCLEWQSSVTPPPPVFPLAFPSRNTRPGHKLRLVSSICMCVSV